MIRKIIHIDEEKCNGCGLCANACHEGAIDIIDGKAKLTREHFCDGFGDCLPNCPIGAITFEEREAPEYDAEAVKESQRKKQEEKAMQEQAQHTGSNQQAVQPGMQQVGQQPSQQHVGCPGSRIMQFNNRDREAEDAAETASNANAEAYAAASAKPKSRLGQWPVQIKLAPLKAPYFEGAKLLIAADCTAYAYANMHEEFMRGKITIIGCPKLDAVDYSDKLTEIIRNNDIRSVTIVRMEVPCCGGLQRAAENALRASGKFIPWQVVTISIDGRILD